MPLIAWEDIMKKYTLLKTTAASSMIAALLSITTGCVTAPGYNAYGDLYEDIYKDTPLSTWNKQIKLKRRVTKFFVEYKA